LRFLLFVECLLRESCISVASHDSGLVVDGGKGVIEELIGDDPVEQEKVMAGAAGGAFAEKYNVVLNSVVESFFSCFYET
jgi:hypothetical protein